MSYVQMLQCDECKHVGRVDTGTTWLLLRDYNASDSSALAQFPNDAHFCTTDCLKKHYGAGEPTHPLEQPVSKTRRFTLIDGETADEREGVLWGNGCVTLPEPHGWHYVSWDMFKSRYPGCGVMWIDQEVKTDASN